MRTMQTTQHPAVATMRRAIFPTVVVDQAKGDEPSIVISTGAVDRVGDVLIPAGADLTHYMRNPVVLFGHDNRDLPIGMTTAITAEDTGLRASWRWLENDERANRVRNAWNQGVLRAASVGFRPIEMSDAADSDGYQFDKWELVEWSLCCVPANPEAIRTLQALGLDNRNLPIRRSRPEVDRLLQIVTSVNAHVKAGRVLSAANEAALRRAVAELQAVLAQLDSDSSGDKVLVLDDEEPVTRRSLARRHETGDRLLVDGIELPCTAREFCEITVDVTKRQLTDALMRLTGRLD